ncbi:hypothetical protein QQZ08_008031 [Neonectria magnoliae]|uniref:Uncharacterized protein n=1 Tax=Neonectria magnoliae TaxID=2732573 RepID=A0ABR1HWP7_9HYPO
MRLSLAFAALCAIPALSQATNVEERGLSSDYEYDGQGHHRGHPHWPHHKPHPYQHYKEHHKHPHHHKEHHHKEHDHKDHHVYHPHKEYKYHKHPHHHKHKHHQHNVLTDHLVCDRLNHFADKAEHIHNIVEHLQCGYDDRCWKKVKDALYELEIELDFFDIAIDKSNLDKCFTCTQESKIACCYRTYAEALIRLLRLVKKKSEYLEGETDKYVLTAINSLRAADSAFIYELGRRMHCQEYLKQVMLKQGAVDGSTKGSIQEAFSKFTFTPLITGEHFKGKGHHEHYHHKEHHHKEHHHGHHHHHHHHKEHHHDDHHYGHEEKYSQ